MLLLIFQKCISYLSVQITLICQDPDMACALLGSSALPEVGVHGQVVTNTVLPSVILGFVVGEVVCDPLVDAGDRQGGFVSEGEGDEVSVGVVWFAAASLRH